MLVEQIAVFLENRKGRLAAMTEALSEANIDLVSLNIADTNDFGIVRIISTNNENALAVLKQKGFTARISQLIGIELNDTPGALASVLRLLSDNEIELEYLYSFARIEQKKAIVLLKVSEEDRALKALVDSNISFYKPQ